MSGRTPFLLPQAFSSGSSDTAAMRRYLETLSKQLNNLKVAGGGGRFLIRNDGIDLILDSGSSSGLDVGGTFTISFVNNTSSFITVDGGYVTHGENKILVAGTNITITGGTSAAPLYVYLEYNPVAATAVISTVATATYMTSSDNKFRRVLYSCYKSTDGNIVVLRRHNYGDIHFNGFV